MGAKVLIHFKNTVKNLNVYFKGMITRMELLDADGASKGFMVYGTSPTLLLDEASQSRTFENESLTQIIEGVTQNVPKGLLEGVEVELTQEKSREYTVQYNETDYQFLQRLAVQYGKWFYYDGEHLRIGKTKTYSATISSGVNLHEFTIKSRLQSQKIINAGYDYQSANQVKAQSIVPQNNSKSYFARNAQKTSQDIFNRKNNYYSYHNRSENESALTEQQSLYQQGREAATITYSGRSILPLQIGGSVRIVKEGVESRFVTTHLKHYSKGVGHYDCYFEAIPADVKAPPYTDPYQHPRADTQSAVVTDNNDPQGMGRIRVQFAWQQESTWLRMVTPHAGGNKGFYFIPEVGEEVLISFEGGNPEKPFVLGTHYNGAAMSGYATPNNDQKVIHTRSGTKIILNDAEGSVFIEDPSGNTYLMDGQGNINVNAPKNIDMFAGEDMNLTIGRNLTFDVGNQALFNVFKQMMVNTPFLQQIIADYYHTEAGKALINSENEIKLEAKETNIAGTQKLFMHSDETTTVNSKGTVLMKGEQGNKHSNVADSYVVSKGEMNVKCIVQFRPHDKWNGEFGFDWIRMGDNDTGRHGDKYWYRDIIGNYRDGSGNLHQIYYGGSFKQDNNRYTALWSEYKVLSIPWKKDFYITPVLTLMPNKSAKFTLKLEIEEEPKELVYEIDKSYYQLNKYKISKTSKGKHTIYNDLEVTNLKLHDNPILLKTFAIAQNGNKSLVGQIKILPNSSKYRKKINIVLVTVQNGTGSFGTLNIAFCKRELTKYLHQALVEPTYTTDSISINTDLDPTARGQFNLSYTTYGADSNQVMDILNDEMKNRDSKYADYLKVYFIDDTVGGLYGRAYDIGSTERSVVVFNIGFNDSTLPHEALHALNLYHTFDNDSKYTFLQAETDNIMDYSDFMNRTFPVIGSAVWQWERIWKFLT